jgi:exosortase
MEREYIIDRQLQYGTAPLRRRNRPNWIVASSAALLIACYLPTLSRMCQLWWNDEDLGHCFAVPIVIVWIVWRERSRWLKIPPTPSWWGILLLTIGGALQFAGLTGVGSFTESVAFLVSTTGLVLALGGIAILRAWAFPLILMLFLLPKLAILYTEFTVPLQLLSTRFAASMLSVIGTNPQVDGNLLNVRGHVVAITEACNGLRYLLALGFVSAVVGYVVETPLWIRWMLFATALPLAILGNAVRVAAAAAVPALDAGWPHDLCGIVVFTLCLAAIAGFRAALVTTTRRANV